MESKGGERIQLPALSTCCIVMQDHEDLDSRRRREVYVPESVAPTEEEMEVLKHRDQLSVNQKMSVNKDEPVLVLTSLFTVPKTRTIWMVKVCPTRLCGIVMFNVDEVETRVIVCMGRLW